jgi:hypothetical protein
MVDDPITGEALDVSSGVGPAPFTLLHGTADDVIPVAVSRDWAAMLTGHGWPVEVVELPTDHGAIAGATYRADVDRYFPADDRASLAIADDVAARIVAAASSTS